MGLAYLQLLGVAYVKGVSAIDHGVDHSYTRAALVDPKRVNISSTLSVVVPILNTSVPSHRSDWLKSSVARHLAPF